MIYNQEAEEGVTSAVFIDGTLKSILSPEDFHDVRIQHIWTAFQSLSAIDPITVTEELKRAGKYDIVGEDYIAHLLSVFSTTLMAESYADIVRNYAENRKIIYIMSEIAIQAYAGEKTGQILANLAILLKSVDPLLKSNTVELYDAVSGAFDATGRASRGELTFIKTGIRQLDLMISGFTPPDLVIVAARPGVGKTSLLTSIMYNIIYSDTPKKIAFFSLEMSNEQVAMRFISMRTGISTVKQRTGRMTDEEFDTLLDGVESLTKVKRNLYINDTSAITPKGIREELDKLGNVNIIFVDYLQLMTADVKSNYREQEVGYVSRELKAIAKEYNLPVIAAAQLNRAIESRSNQTPQLSDLRESGSLEQEADIIIFLHQEEGNFDKTLYLKKHRHGEVGQFFVKFDGTRTYYSDSLIQN